MENIFEQVLLSLNENKINYEVDETDSERGIYFNLSILERDVLCVLEHEFENGTIRFYFELLEYEDEEDSLDAESFCNIFNYNSTFLKAYIDDRNVVCLEYYAIANKDTILETFDALVGDIYENEETLNTFFEE